MEKIKKLKPIKENLSYQDKIEKEIIKRFKKEFFEPMISTFFNKVKIVNSNYNKLEYALKSGEIYYSKNAFYGKFNSSTSKDLKEIGAIFDKNTSSFKIKLEDIPLQVRNTISISKAGFDHNIDLLEKRLVSFDSEEFSKNIPVSKYFDTALWDVENEFNKSVEKITISPKLTKEQRDKVSKEWETNLQLYIKKFTDEQILELRQKVKDNVLAGNRRENLIKTFVESYGVTERKAKFLARQETNLMMAKYKETRYVSAGVPEYEWRCVHMPHQSSPNAVYKPGEVRYSHSILEGKIFSWNFPYEIDINGNQKSGGLQKPQQGKCNPGQDYNCRCFAIPVVRFK